MDPPDDSVADYTFKDNATGAFALGTHGEVVLAQLDYSLDYILNTGVERIQAHARTLTSRLKTELPQRGYTLLTPPESTTPLVAFLLPDARNKLSARLKEEKIRMTLNHNHCRVSISVFNSSDDIDHLLSLLGRRPI
jgi:selenocysteine lyase/cysteine desulfurase